MPGRVGAGGCDLAAHSRLRLAGRISHCSARRHGRRPPPPPRRAMPITLTWAGAEAPPPPPPPPAAAARRGGLAIPSRCGEGDGVRDHSGLRCPYVPMHCILGSYHDDPPKRAGCTGPSAAAAGVASSGAGWPWLADISGCVRGCPVSGSAGRRLCAGPRHLRLVPPPRNKYGDRNPDLAEIYLRL
jgi:hypothetical protein